MKKLFIALLISAMTFSMAACSKSEPQKTQVNINVKDSKEEVKEETQETVTPVKALDAKSVADALLNEIAYVDQLSEIDLETAAMFYVFDGIDIENVYIYESSGATAEEIAVIECKDETNAKKVMDVFKGRISDQIESYESYVPEEVPKLKDAVMEQVGNVAILSVSGDSKKAKEIIGK